MSEREREADRTVPTTTIYISPLWILTQSLATVCQALLATVTNIFTHVMPLGGHTLATIHSTLKGHL